MMNLKNLARRFRKDERGVTLVEYGIGVTLAVVVGVTALGGLGTTVSTAMGLASAEICDGEGGENVTC